MPSGEPYQRERLSYRATPVRKFRLPVGALIVTAIAVAVVATMPDRLPWPDGSPPSWLPWVVAAAGVAIAIVLGRVTLPLKRVDLQGEDLMISNYFREIRVPLRFVTRVSVLSGAQIDGHPVAAIEVDHPTRFGEVVQFVPVDEFALMKLERYRLLAWERAAASTLPRAEDGGAPPPPDAAVQRPAV